MGTYRPSKNTFAPGIVDKDEATTACRCSCQSINKRFRAQKALENRERSNDAEKAGDVSMVRVHTSQTHTQRGETLSTFVVHDAGTASVGRVGTSWGGGRQRPHEQEDAVVVVCVKTHCIC